MGGWPQSSFILSQVLSRVLDHLTPVARPTMDYWSLCPSKSHMVGHECI